MLQVLTNKRTTTDPVNDGHTDDHHHQTDRSIGGCNVLVTDTP